MYKDFKPFLKYFLQTNAEMGQIKFILAHWKNQSCQT